MRYLRDGGVKGTYKEYDVHLIKYSRLVWNESFVRIYICTDTGMALAKDDDLRALARVPGHIMKLQATQIYRVG